LLLFINLKIRPVCYQGKMDIQRNISPLFLCLVAFAVLYPSFLIPRDARAQTISTPAIFEGVIDKDEEGGAMSLPSFVLAEPVRKEIYVIDSKARIIIYTSDFFPLYTLGQESGIEKPQGLAVDGDGTLYVAQPASEGNPHNRISVFSPCLKWKRDIILKGFEGDDTFYPYRVARDKNGNMYVAGLSFPGVLVLDADERFTDMIIPEEDGKKVKLNDVVLDKKGRIYLVSEDTGHVYVYDGNRKFLFKFGEKGGSSGKLSRPRAIGIDGRNGRMYVVDYMRHTILVYDSEGRYVFEFGGMGWGEGWFQYPTDLAVDSEGRILIADFFNNRIQVFYLR